MKKLIASLAIVGSICAFADIDDTSVLVSTTGPDTYADGTTVLDGECYALCWSAGDFGGIKADGSLVNSSDEILGIYPAAKDGKCKLFKYTLTADAFNRGGYITLWLLDTRVYAEDGTASLAKQTSTTQASVVNGAAQVKASVSVASVGATDVKGDEAVATAATALPANVPSPKIKSIKIGDVYVEIEVENTVPYLRYDIAAGAKPSELKGDAATANPSGDASKTITLYTEKKGDSGFFQVNKK